VPLAQDHAFLLDRLDETLDEGVCVRGAEGGLAHLDAAVANNPSRIPAGTTPFLSDLS
jgi:hypothetical protein